MQQYKRILIKISGEALAGANGHGIDFDQAAQVCRNIGKAASKGTEVALVVGAGNFWRGRQGTNLDQVKADQMGMLGTMINALALQEIFRMEGQAAVVFSAIVMPQISETYTKDNAVRALQEGKIVIFGGGTGSPFFTTDTTAALRAVEINADLALMAKNIDGVYDKDPRKFSDAKKLKTVTYREILAQKLGVIDMTAASLCMDNNLPVLLFELGNGENILRVLQGEHIGTIICN